MNPWLEALLWGALGLVAALIVTIVVMLFSRASPGAKEGERRPL
jgi:predicted PurR-regulated permease PerM